jgi:ABC-type uncharacterized transport system involved in gliding motility auxiliary subunit
MRRFLFSVVGVLAVLAAVVGINLFADTRLARVRADLTAQRLYTLSDGTLQILQNLRDPITLRLFYSRRLGTAIPVYGAYADRVREMLAEYVAASNGRIRLEVFDPEPFSETEDRAVAFGLQGVPVDQSGEQIYFGLAGSNLLDDERTIPFFQPERERFLEYDLTRIVFELSNPRRPIVGLLSPLPISGDPRMMMMMRQRGAQGGQPWIISSQLRQFFTLRDVPTDALLIDPDIQVLILAHPQGLNDATLYAVDQFVMRGGRLMVLVDPHSEAQAGAPSPTGQPPASTSSNPARLFEAWGIAFDPDQVVLDLQGAIRVRASPQDRVQAVDYVAWFNNRNGLSRADVATADLQQVTFASAGFVARRDGAAVEFTPIIESSDQSMAAPAERVRNDPNPSRILAEFRADGQRRVLAARVRGTLRSAFTEAPAPPEGVNRPANFPAHIAQVERANLVVIADTDILEDRFWVRVQDFFGQQAVTPFSDNGALIGNLTDTLAGGDSLIGLRSRGESLRPFERVDAMRRAAEARFRATERELQTKLETAERRLRELRTGQGGADAARSAVITAEQRATIDQLRREIVDTRRQLRDVQLELRRDIESLSTSLRLANVVAVPALLALFAIVLGIARARRRALARA